MREKSPLLGPHKSPKHCGSHPQHQSFPGTLQKGTSSLVSKQQAHPDLLLTGLLWHTAAASRARQGDPSPRALLHLDSKQLITTSLSMFFSSYPKANLQHDCCQGNELFALTVLF